jgi:excinuclease ABC subunit C
LGGKGLRVGLVVFENGRRKPEDSRQYAFANLEGAGDDYAALAAWAKRRVESGPPWPDLVLVDGARDNWLLWSEASPKPTVAGTNFRSSNWRPLQRTSRRAGELEDRIFRPGRKNPLPWLRAARNCFFSSPCAMRPTASC